MSQKHQAAKRTLYFCCCKKCDATIYNNGNTYNTPVGRIIVIGVVHVQCCELFKVVYSAVYGTVHCKEPLKSFDKSRYSPGFGLSFCRDIIMVVQKAT